MYSIFRKDKIIWTAVRLGVARHGKWQKRGCREHLGDGDLVYLDYGGSYIPQCLSKLTELTPGMANFNVYK